MKKYFLPLFLLFLTVACIKKNDFNFKNLKFTNWTPDWALPFISSALTMQNMLNSQTLITTDSATGLLSLKYAGTNFTFKAADYIKIPDQHFTTPPVSLTNPITSLSFTGSASDSFGNNFSYNDTNGSHLAHIGIKSGNINVSFTSTFNQNLDIQIIFPNIKNNGVPLILPVSIVYPNTTSIFSADLTNYVIDFTNGGTTNNYIAYKIKYTITGVGQPMDPTCNLSASVDITNLQYSFIDGSLGRFVIPIPYDTIKIGVLSKAVAANIKLQNPKLNVSFASSFGMTVSASLDSMYAFAPNGSMDTVKIPALIIKGDTSLYQPTFISKYVVDSTNSNLRNILSPVPNFIVYEGHIAINPTGSSGYNFLTDTSSISISFNAELPACFQIIQLALQDTVKMQMPPDTTMLTKAQFAMQVTNSFPVYASAQVYFTDSNYMVLDSLITPYNNLIAPAIVNSSGIVIDSSVQVTNFIMDKVRYTAMASRIRHGIIRGNLYTSGTGYIQLHATDHLRIKSAFRFTLDYNL